MITSVNAASAYAAARPTLAPDTSAGAGATLNNAAEEFAQQMASVDSVATGAMSGNVETHQLVQTLAESQLAMETVVAIRDKVVEAYQEILRMPV